MSLFLGIDTSNYTTSVALYDSATGEIAQKKQLLPVREGQLGLRQSDAVFHHTAQLHTLFGELLEGVNPREIAAIGVSTRPRPVDGSGKNFIRRAQGSALCVFASGGTYRGGSVQREER